MKWAATRWVGNVESRARMWLWLWVRWADWLRVTGGGSGRVQAQHVGCGHSNGAVGEAPNDTE